nr:DUF1641 domain-containing protein [Ardenticatena sp.]
MTVQPTVGLEERLDRLESRLTTLSERFEAVAERLDLVVEMAERQQAAALERRDLGRAMQPVMHDAYEVLVDELRDLEQVLTQEELVTLVRRLAWNVRNLNRLLDTLESMADLADALGPIAHDAYHELMRYAEEADKRGYVPFLLEVGYVVDRIITGFTPEDVRQLGDHVVLILNTVKELTQPQMMHLLSQVTNSLQEAEHDVAEMPTDLRSLLRMMRDPQVRRGLAVVLAALRGMAPQNEQTKTSKEV